MNEDKQWDNWVRSTLATANTHGCENIFTDYVPTSTEEKELFFEQQKFMYAVFETCLQTSMGRHNVCQHQNDFDAQTIYKKMLHHASRSTQATIDVDEILTYISTNKLHTSNWRGKAHDYILNWCDKMRQYEDKIELQDHFSDRLKMTMLQNAVSGIPSLQAVKTQDAHGRAHGKRGLTYDKYLVLLLSAASVYDEKSGLSRPRNCQLVNSHDTYPYEHLEYDDDKMDVFDIDTDLPSIEVHATDRRHNTRPFRSTMKKEQWNSRTPREKELWDKFSSPTKAVILGYREPPPTQSPTTPMHRKFNLHKMSAAEYISMLHSQHDHAENTSDHGTEDGDQPFFDSKANLDDNSSPGSVENTAEGLLVYVTKQSLPPGDLRCVLSSNPTYTKKPVPYSKPKESVTFANTVTIDGKKYRQVNVHERTTYNVSNHKASDRGSLIDRGANGGLAGSDVRIVHKHANPRYVDVSRIDSHQVTDLPIVTVGGVAPSQRGDVIVIMHQYAYIGEGKTIHSSAQLEHYKNDVNDKSLKVSGGLQ